MYLVGIDVSKFKHDCFIVTDNGEVVKKPFSFDNSRDGFLFLINVLNQLDKTKEIRIGLEATGHYGTNLKNFLKRNDFDFAEFNPYLIKKFGESFSLRKTKTDKVDAKLIAQVLMVVDYKTYIKHFNILSFKSLTRLRGKLVKSRSKYLVQLTNLLDVAFPEFKPFFDNRFTKTTLFILKKYKTADKIANMDKVNGFTEIKTMSRHKYKDSKLTQLVKLARNTIGTCDDYTEIQIDIILDMIFKLEEHIINVEKEIENIMSEIDTIISSIPGIGIQSAAIIVSEYEDFNRFENPGQMLAFAGLDVRINQSGTSEQHGKMVKRGSGQLRYGLMSVANALIINNYVFSEYYYKKRSEGKCHRVACSHVVKKLIRIIYHLEKNQMNFDYNKI